MFSMFCTILINAKYIACKSAPETIYIVLMMTVYQDIVYRGGGEEKKKKTKLKTEKLKKLKCTARLSNLSAYQDS